MLEDLGLGQIIGAFALVVSVFTLMVVVELGRRIHTHVDRMMSKTESRINVALVKQHREIARQARDLRRLDLDIEVPQASQPTPTHAPNF